MGKEKKGAVNAAKSSTNPAAAIASQLEASAKGKGRPKVPLKELEDDDGTNGAAPQEIEFVHSKDARVAKRKWAADQEQKGALPKKPAGLSPFARLLIVVSSTLGLLLFGYRMYLNHYGPTRRFLLYTKAQLAKHNANATTPWIAIVGEVYDVSKAPQYYGKQGSYGFFSGVDASRAYITGGFSTDLNDNVTDFTDAQCAGLVQWKAFYLKEYKYKGRLIGAFFDEQGAPTEMQRRVIEGGAAHKAAEAERKNKRLAYPDCSSRWSQNDGSEVWCDNGQHPRRLTEVVGGKREQRCACFEQKGWSDLRQVYQGCDPSAHRCKLIVDEETKEETKEDSKGEAASEEVASTAGTDAQEGASEDQQACPHGHSNGEASEASENAGSSQGDPVKDEL